MKPITLLVSCLVAIAGSGVGCKRNETPTPGAVSKPTTDAPKAADKAAATDPELAIITITAVGVDTKLAEMCGIPSSQVYFKFDSAVVRPEAKELLDKIATCAQSGPAKGKALRVIGRTDPRGSEESNQELGKARAEAVASYLRAQGVAGARVETISKGEADADPVDPWGWPYDRRVTVRLGD